MSSDGRRQQCPISEVEKAELRTKLMNSVVRRPTHIANFDDSLPDTVEDIECQLQDYHTKYRHYESRAVFIKCMMGRNMLEIRRKTGLKGKRLTVRIREILPDCVLSNSELYFLMKLYKVTETYSRLAHVTVDVSLLKNKFRIISKILEEDETHWTY